MDVPTLVELEEQPLLAPVTPSMSWNLVHSLSQTSLAAHSIEPIASIRRTATIRRGTRMVKLLSRRQFTGYLYGRLPGGFCYRAVDLAGLQGPADLAMLTGDTGHLDGTGEQVVFGLRWRATDPRDYAIPFSQKVGQLPSYPGLTRISPNERVGPPVLGTGFALSSHHLIPEFVTEDLADVPMPAGTTLVAFTPDGTEVSLYLYLPEQRAWTRMYGPHWRHLVSGMPEVAPDQEYVQMTTDHTGGSTLLGTYNGEQYEALADPPHEFRVLAKARAARYRVESLTRRTKYTHWRGADCTVVRIEGDWVRLRLCRPDSSNTLALAAQCVERGLYEVWAPAAELELYDVDVDYRLD